MKSLRWPWATFTEEEKRAIHERWVRAKIARVHALNQKYKVLEEQMEQIARHVGCDLKKD